MEPPPLVGPPSCGRASLVLQYGVIPVEGKVHLYYNMVPFLWKVRAEACKSGFTMHLIAISPPLMPYTRCEGGCQLSPHFPHLSYPATCDRVRESNLRENWDLGLSLRWSSSSWWCRMDCWWQAALGSLPTSQATGVEQVRCGTG